MAVTTNSDENAGDEVQQAPPTGGRACCAPSKASTALSAAAPHGGVRAGDHDRPALLRLDGSTFLMGSDEAAYLADGEGPIRSVRVDSYGIGAHAVTNVQFERFVSATGYRTTAEVEGASFVFGGLLPDGFPPTQGVATAPWWRLVEDSSWLHPEGTGSSLGDRGDHPVVHVSWFDAVAYSEWAGCRLPTEAEWEHAARGGLEQQRFPWGDELDPGGNPAMNVFRGTFPTENTATDGYRGTAPVDAFAANGYGLHNTCGNVWEWCSDWFSPTHGQPRPNPQGPHNGTHRTMRGGSYLCHESYCWRYRCAARSPNTPDSSAGNVGFRVAGD